MVLTIPKRLRASGLSRHRLHGEIARLARYCAGKVTSPRETTAGMPPAPQVSMIDQIVTHLRTCAALARSAIAPDSQRIVNRPRLKFHSRGLFPHLGSTSTMKIISHLL